MTMLLALLPALLAADSILVEVRVLSTPSGGLTLRGPGDLNGDGLDDVLYGGWDQPLTLWYGGALDEPVFLFADDTLRGELFGIDASGGDINGDGYDDLIVGSSDLSVHPMGAFYVWTGGPNGVTPESWLRVESPGAQDDHNDNFGVQVHVVGDLDGDGDEELAVSAPHEGLYGAFTGPVWLYDGGELPGQAQPLRDQEGYGDGQWFGWAVAPGGDVDGDGHSDLLVLSLIDSSPQRYALRLYLGGPQGVDPFAPQVTEPAGVSFPRAYVWDGLTEATDLDQDGFDDAALAGVDPEGAAVVHVLHGSAAGFDEELQVPGPDQPDADFAWGLVLASPGDLSGDGLPDLFVVEDDLEGLGWLLLGDTSRGYSVLPLEAEGHDNLIAGTLGDVAGDVDGDGVNELVILAYDPEEEVTKAALLTALPLAEGSDSGDTDLGSDKTGCGCATGPAPSASWALLLLALRRRRRARANPVAPLS